MHTYLQNPPNSLEENADRRLSLTQAITDFSEKFLDDIPKRKAFHYNTHRPTPADDFFGIDSHGYSVSEILDFYEARVLDVGLNPASGGHLGYIPGGGIFSAAIADYLAAVTNRYAGEFYASPGAVRMEESVIEWTAKLLGYPDGSGGNLTSGGSIANLIALHTAKHHKQISGNTIQKSVVYCTSQSHHSIYKALKIIGLQECIVHTIAIDEQFRMSAETLRQQVKKDKEQGLNPFLLIANAGSTDVGAVDPLVVLAQIATENNLWYHIDAAYGGFFMLTTKGKAKLEGIASADSVILDPHKGMFLPYGSGIVLIKDRRHMAAAHSFEANYMRDAHVEGQYSPSNLSPELSKHFRGLRMWLPLKLYGEAIFAEYLTEKLQLADYLAEKLQTLGFRLICKPDLSVVAFRMEESDKDCEEENNRILTHIQKDGRIFISSTILDGKLTLRAAILSFRTHKMEIDLFLQLLKEAKLA